MDTRDGREPFPGRFALGVGVSSHAIVEGWHGVPWTNPIARTKESVELLKLLFAGERANFDGREISSQFDSSSRVLGLMRESFEHVFPQLRRVPFEPHWGGAIALTPNHLPRVGVSTDGGVAYAHGCGGHGVARSYLWAGSGLDMLYGEDTDRVQLPLTSHSGLRYPLEPVRFLAGRATRLQLRWYDDVVQAGRKGDREPPLVTLLNKVFTGESRPN
jgi:Luciferase-like monooxygenase